jgi:hypothetical protein
MRLKLPLIVTLLFACSTPVLGANDPFMTGTFMLPHCKAASERPNPGVWGGHCAGIIEALGWIGSSAGRLCLPAGGITGAQAQRVVVRWLEMHPEKLHLDFKELAMEALVDVWPCRKQ